MSGPQVIWDDQPKPPPSVATAPQVQWDDEVTTPDHPTIIPQPPQITPAPIKPAPVQVAQPPAAPPPLNMLHVGPEGQPHEPQPYTAKPIVQQAQEPLIDPVTGYPTATIKAVQAKADLVARGHAQYTAEEQAILKAVEAANAKSTAILSTANKYAVQPFERMAQAGANVGRNIGEGVVTAPPAENTEIWQDPEKLKAYQEQARKESPRAVGITRAVGSTVGGMAADPRMWPFFFSGGAAPGLQRVATAGFAGQMGAGAIEQASDLGKIMYNPDIPQEDKWEAGANLVLTTIMAAQATGHATRGVHPDIGAAVRDFDNLPPADQEGIRQKLREKSPEIAAEIDKLAGPQAAPKVEWDDQGTAAKPEAKAERFRLPRGVSAQEVQGAVKGPNIRTVDVGGKTYAFDQRKTNADGVTRAVERGELWRLTGGKAPEAAKVQAEQDVRGEEPAPEAKPEEAQAQPVQWDDEEKKQPEPQTKVQVPVMITRQMETDLRARGVSQQEIDRMTQEQAHAKLQEPQAPTPEPVQASSPTNTDHQLVTFDEYAPKEHQAVERVRKETDDIDLRGQKQMEGSHPSDKLELHQKHPYFYTKDQIAELNRLDQEWDRTVGNLSAKRAEWFSGLMEAAKSGGDIPKRVMDSLSPGFKQKIDGVISSAAINQEHGPQPERRQAENAAITPEEERRTAETARRQNVPQRKTIDQMTPEEKDAEIHSLRQDLNTSEKTGLPNRRAFEEDEQTMAESHPHVGYADLDDFKRYNDALGHEGVDKAVLPAVGKLFTDAAAKEPAGSVKVYHRSGDEFNFRATTPEAIKRVTDRVNQELAETTFKYEKKDGTIVEKKGTGLSHGIGRDHESAETASEADKQRRKATGLREGTRDVPAVDTSGAARVEAPVSENTGRHGVQGQPERPAEEVKPTQTISGHLNGRRSAKIGTVTLPDKTVLELSVRPDPSQMGTYSLVASNGKNSTSYRMQYKGRETLADVRKQFEDYLNIDSPGNKVTIGTGTGAPVATPVSKAPEPPPRRVREKMAAERISDFERGKDKVVREDGKTFVVDKTGTRKKIEVKSDVITPEFKTNTAKLTLEQREKMIEAVRTTPYLSDEGRKERLDVLQAREPISTAKQEAPAREPWQMSRDEWENSPQFKADEDGTFPPHEDIVLDALQRGDAVPPTVRNEYGYERIGDKWYGKNAAANIRADQKSAITQFDEAVAHTGAEVKTGQPSPEFAEKIKAATPLEPANDAELKEKFKEAAYQREYFKAALQEAKDKWLSIPGMNDPQAAWDFSVEQKLSNVPTDKRPSGVKADQIYVKVPGDGHFLINNNPFSIEKALNGAREGFTPPRQQESKLNVPRSPKEFDNAKYIAQLEKEIKEIEDRRKQGYAVGDYDDEQLKAARENLRAAKAGQAPEAAGHPAGSKEAGPAEPAREAIAPTAKPDTVKTLEREKAKLQKTKSLTPDELATYFTPGRIVPGYSGNDKVIAFHPAELGAAYPKNHWRVDVVRVDSEGNPAPGERARNHATAPVGKEAIALRREIIKAIDAKIAALAETAPEEKPESIATETGTTLHSGINPIAAGHAIAQTVKDAAGLVKKGSDWYHGKVDNGLNLFGSERLHIPGLEDLHMGQTRPEIRQYDDAAADLATKVDAGGAYHKAVAEAIGKKVTGPLAEPFDKTDNYAARQKKNEISRDRMKGFHFLADSQNREWLEENHPEDFHRWSDDPKIKEALDAYKPFESQLRGAVKQLGGKTIDEDYIKRIMDFATSGVAYEGKTLAQGAEGPEPIREGRANVRGGGRDNVISPQIDRSKARKDAGQYYWDHGVFDFGPSFEKRWVEVMSKLDEHRLAVHAMSMGTRIAPGEEAPDKVFYNGQEFYRGDIAKEIREVQKRGVSSESKDLADALGVSELPAPKDVRTYDMYEPLRRGSRFETAARSLASNVLAGKEDLAGQAASVNRMAQLKYALPKEIVEALNDAGREKEMGRFGQMATRVLGPLTRFIRQQIVGLAYGIPHMANIMRKVVQSHPAGALNPVGWADAFKVAFSKELKARGINGVDDPTYNMLLRHAAISEGALPEYRHYVEGNFAPENWEGIKQALKAPGDAIKQAATTAGNAFRKGGRTGAKVTPLSAAAGVVRLAVEPLNRFSEAGHANLFKQGAIDQRARIWLADFLKDRYPGMGEQRIAHEVNQTLGRYNRASWTDIQKSLGPFMLFPGWDYSSIAFAMKHPFNTAVAPAVLMLLANTLVHSIGGNKNDEKHDLERVHVGKYSIRANIFNDNMGSHLWGWALRGGKAVLDRKNAKGVTGEMIKGIPGDVAGVTSGTLNPIISAPLSVGYDRTRPGGTQEIVPRGDLNKKGKLLPNKAAEDYLDFATRKAFPIYDRATQAGQRPSLASFAGLAGVNVSQKKKKR